MSTILKNNIHYNLKNRVKDWYKLSYSINNDKTYL